MKSQFKVRRDATSQNAATGQLPLCTRSRARNASGFTLIEVVMCILVIGMVFAGILTGYVQSAKRAEWAGYSLAVQAYGIQQLEQAQSAVWDVSASINTNQLCRIGTSNNMIGWTYTNNVMSGYAGYMGYTWTNIDIPYSGTNYVRATNFVKLATNVVVSVAPPIYLEMVQVDSVWWQHGKPFTNTLVNYYAPDQ